VWSRLGGLVAERSTRVRERSGFESPVGLSQILPWLAFTI